MAAHSLLLAVHTVAYAIFYVLPRAIFYATIKLPLTLIESSIGDQITFSQNDFEIQVACNWKDKATLRLFGLLEEGMLYPSPLYNGHIQTILGAGRLVPRVSYRRVVMEGDDGCPIGVDWAVATPLDSCKGIFVILPGLCSTSKSPYIRDFVLDATRSGYHCAIINPRGMGDAPPVTTPRLNTGVFTDDIRTMLRNNLIVTHAANEGIIAHTSFPVLPIGFSLGGSILCNYLSEEGLSGNTDGTSHITASFAVCAPWDMHDTAAALRSITAHFLYQGALTSGLAKYFLKHRDILAQLPEFDGSLLLEQSHFRGNVRTTLDYDRLITAPHCGFNSQEEYYTAGSSILKLHHCPVPLLCIGAQDDPVCPPPALRRWEHIAQSNPNVVFAMMPAGGHLGFLQNPIQEARRRPVNAMHTTVLYSADCVLRKQK